jgi:hypothetical protein
LLVLGVEFGALCLLGRHSTTWTTLKSIFALVIFWGRVAFYAQAGLDGDPLICASPYSWGDRHTSACPAIGWDRVSWTFCQDWPQTMILLISASQVDITSVSHHTWLFVCFWLNKIWWKGHCAVSKDMQLLLSPLLETSLWDISHSGQMVG